jgi:hypothetical protein
MVQIYLNSGSGGTYSGSDQATTLTSSDELWNLAKRGAYCMVTVDSTIGALLIGGFGDARTPDRLLNQTWQWVGSTFTIQPTLQIPFNRAYHTCIAVDGNVFVIGGYDSGTIVSTVVQRLGRTLPAGLSLSHRCVDVATAA